MCHNAHMLILHSTARIQKTRTTLALFSFDRSGIRSPRPVLAHSDRFDQFDQSLKQCLPIVLGFDKMARLHFQALTQARITDNFESRVAGLRVVNGEHLMIADSPRNPATAPGEAITALPAAITSRTPH